jgi:hypothetical protein
MRSMTLSNVHRMALLVPSRRRATSFAWPPQRRAPSAEPHQEFPHHSFDIDLGPTLEAKRYQGRSNLRMIDQSNSGGSLGTTTFHVSLVDRIYLSAWLSPDHPIRLCKSPRQVFSRSNAVRAARFVDRGFAQHVRAIHSFAACRHLQRHRSRRFRASGQAFIEGSPSGFAFPVRALHRRRSDSASAFPSECAIGRNLI